MQGINVVNAGHNKWRDPQIAWTAEPAFPSQVQVTCDNQTSAVYMSANSITNGGTS